MAELMETRLGPRNYVLDGVHMDATWRTRLNDQCVVEMCNVLTSTGFKDFLSFSMLQQLHQSHAHTHAHACTHY